MKLRNVSSYLRFLIDDHDFSKHSEYFKEHMAGFNDGVTKAEKLFPPFNNSLKEKFEMPIKVTDRNIDLLRDQPDARIKEYIVKSFKTIEFAVY